MWTVSVWPYIVSEWHVILKIVSVVLVVVSVIRWEVSVGDSVVVACVSVVISCELLFTCGKNYLLGHPTFRGWSKRLAPKWFITAKKLVSHLVWIRLMFPVCASDGRAGFFFWRENDFVANLDENVNINIKEVVFRIKYITFARIILRPAIKRGFCSL